MTELKHVAIYLIIFVLGTGSFELVYVFVGRFLLDFAIIIALSAGLAATIAAWLVRQPYRRALADDRRKALYGWLLLGVFSAHLLIGFLHLLIGFLITLLMLFIGNSIRLSTIIMQLSEIISLSLAISLFSVLSGFVHNMLFGTMLTEFLRHMQKKGAIKCV